MKKIAYFNPDGETCTADEIVQALEQFGDLPVVIGKGKNSSMYPVIFSIYELRGKVYIV